MRHLAPEERKGSFKEMAFGFNEEEAKAEVVELLISARDLIVRLSESKSPIEFVPWDFTDVELRIPDVKKAEALLGFRAQMELEQGLLNTIEWYRRKLGGEA